MCTLIKLLPLPLDAEPLVALPFFPPPPFFSEGLAEVFPGDVAASGSAAAFSSALGFFFGEGDGDSSISLAAGGGLDVFGGAAAALCLSSRGWIVCLEACCGEMQWPVIL